MDFGFKKRLIGAVVILLLAAVVLPQVFDGSGRIPDRVTAIPPVFKKPDDSALKVNAPDLSRQQLPEAFNIPIEAAEFQAEVAQLDTVASKNNNENTLIDSLQDKTDVAESNSTVQSVKLPERLQEVKAPTLGWKGGRAQVFAIQVGSFAEMSNAKTLLMQVRAAGFKAYLITNTSNNRTMTQVLVGPIASKERADQTAVSLKSLEGVSSPWVMKYKATTNLLDENR